MSDLQAGSFAARPGLRPIASRSVLLLLGCSLTAAAGQPRPPQAVEAGLLSCRSFSPKEYGGNSQNWAIAQASQGLIYVGNANGVLEFDGVRWRLIRVANRTTVRSLAVDPAGRVYVGAIGEVGFLEPGPSGRARYVSLLDRIPPAERGFGDVYRAFSTKDGVVFATSSRIFRLGASVEVWKTQSSFHLAFQVGERLFAREIGRGLLEFSSGTWSLVPGGERFADAPVHAMLPLGNEGAILLGTRKWGFFVLTRASLLPFPTEADAALERDLIYSATTLADGGLALGTIQGGLYLLDAEGRSRGHLGKGDGLPDPTVWAMAQDSQGGLWLALDKGITRVEVSSAVSSFNGKNGLDATVLSLQRHAGTLYVGSGQGLWRLATAPPLETRFVAVPGLKSQTWGFLSLESSLLIANNFGVYELRGETASLVRPAPSATFALARSSREPARVFVGLADGLASMRSEKGLWIDEGKISGVTEKVRTLLETTDGRLWAGTTTQGVLRVSFPPDWKGGSAAPQPSVERFGPTEGLPDARHIRIYDVAGAPVFATRSGLYRFDEGSRRFAPDMRFAQLFPAGPRWVTGLREEPGGRLWMHAVDEANGLQETGAAVPDEHGVTRWQPTPPLPFTTADADLSTSEGQEREVPGHCSPDGRAGGARRELSGLLQHRAVRRLHAGERRHQGIGQVGQARGARLRAPPIMDGGVANGWCVGPAATCAQ